MKLVKESFLMLILVGLSVFTASAQGLNSEDTRFSAEIRAVSPEFMSFESTGLQKSTLKINPVYFQEQPETSDRKRGFFARYKYWLIGGVTAAAVGTYIILSSSGDGPEMLPEPPPRPS